MATLRPCFATLLLCVAVGVALCGTRATALQEQLTGSGASSNQYEPGSAAHRRMLRMRPAKQPTLPQPKPATVNTQPQMDALASAINNGSKDIGSMFLSAAVLFAAGPLPMQGQDVISQFFEFAVDTSPGLKVDFICEEFFGSSKDKRSVAYGFYTATSNGVRMDWGDFMSVFDKNMAGATAIAVLGISSSVYNNSTFFPYSALPAGGWSHVTKPRPDWDIFNPVSTPFSDPYNQTTNATLDARERAFQIGFNGTGDMTRGSMLGAECTLYQPSFSPFGDSTLKATGAEAAKGLFEIRDLHDQFKYLVPGHGIGLAQRNNAIVIHEGDGTPGDYSMAIESSSGVTYPVYAGGVILHVQLMDTFFDFREMAFPIFLPFKG